MVMVTCMVTISFYDVGDFHKQPSLKGGVLKKSVGGRRQG